MSKLNLDQKGFGHGSYADAHRAFDFEMHPAEGAGKAGEQRPSHDVYIKGANGKPFKAGSAWAKLGKTGRLQGIVFYSLQVDSSGWDSAFNFSAFPAFDVKANKIIPGEFDVVWRRARQDEAA